MSTKIGPYSSYGETKVPWLNEAPAHWETIRLDRLFDLRNEPPQAGDGRVTGYIDGRVTLRSNVARQKIKGVIHEGGWQRIYPGDFAISGMNAHLGGMGVSDSLGKCSPIYLVLQPKSGTNAQYVSLAVRQAAHLGAIKALVQTIRFNSADMKRADLKSIYVQIPPPDEQDAIVRFLRYIDQRVNRLLKTKRRLIELLNEQKQAIIHRAVTRGLNPEVALKPSGVEWLGDVPEHWEVKRMRYACRMNPSISELNGLDPETPASFLPMKKVGIEGNLVLDENRAIKDVSQGFTYFRDQDVIVAKITPCFENGKAAVVNELCNSIGFGSTEFHVLRANRDMSPLYIYFIINSRLFRSLGTGYMYGAGGQKRVPEDFINNFVFAFPPLAEQDAIVAYIKHENAPFDEALRKVRSEIEYIREYRTRLVSDVVTGQLDVRGLVLPEVEDEAGGLDEDGGEEDEGAEEDEEGAGE